MRRKSNQAIEATASRHTVQLCMSSTRQPAAQRVIALGDTPYLGEAHLYRAKALLRQGGGAAALAELHAITPNSNAVGAWARALADSVESRMRR